MSLGANYLSTIRREPTLTAFWRMNDQSGSIDAIDSGSRFDLIGVYATSQVLGPALIQADPSAGSSVFGGSDASFIVSDIAALRIIGDISLEVWIAPYTVSQTSAIIGKMNSGGTVASPYYLGLSNGQIKFSLGNGTTAVTLVAGVPPVSTPSHVAATCFRGTMTIYLDGTAIAIGFLGAQALVDGGQSFYVGSLASTLPFTGLMAEVAVYSGALSARRVARHFTIGQQILFDPAHYVLVDPPVVMPV